MTVSVTALIDTHCHVGDYPDPPQVLAAATGIGVNVVAVTRTPGEYRLLRTRLGRRDGVTIALGIHPQDSAIDDPSQLARFYRHAPAAEWIGEVGLDYVAADAHNRRAQRRVFDAIVTELAARPVPATVHSRGAAKDTVAMLADAGVPAILHWFSGPLDVAETALAAGLAFSVNLAMTRSAKGIALCSLIPQDRVLLETDGPFVRAGRRASEPSDVAGQLLTGLARLWRGTVEQARAQIADNQRRIILATGNRTGGQGAC